jgi:hypothetical protein
MTENKTVTRNRRGLGCCHFLALEKPLNIWEELLPAVDLHLAPEVE